MKVIHQIILVINGLVAVYFLYQAAINLFVYFANKSQGHVESFRLPGMYLCFGLTMAAITVAAWYYLTHGNNTKLGSTILYIPLILVGLFALWSVIMLLSSGGKWN